MLRSPFLRLFRGVKTPVKAGGAPIEDPCYSTISLSRLAASTNAKPAPEKVEVFVDDKRVLCDPGTTIIQVKSQLLMPIASNPFTRRRAPWPAWKYRVSAITNDSR